MLRSLRLKQKLLGLVVLMGAVPFVGTLLTYRGLEEQSQQERLALQTKAGQAAIEKINQHVYAVVAESRGVYMAPDWAVAKPFAESLLVHLKQLDAAVTRLSTEALPEERALIQDVRASTDQFITMRENLVKTAREVSTAAGRAVGDTDLTRSTRKAFNDLLVKLSANYEKHAKANEAAAEHARTYVNLTMLFSSIMPFIGVGVALVLVGAGLSRPIEGIRACILALAEGKLDGPVFGEGRKDEIGDIAHAVGIFRRKLDEGTRERARAETERLEHEVMQKKAQEDAVANERALVQHSIGAGLAKLAAKDLTYRLTDKLPPAYEQLQADFNAAMSTLESALTSVNTRGTAIAATTLEVSSSSEDLARRTERQAASLEETAATLDEITATGKKSAEGAMHARAVVATVRTDAEKAGEVVRRTVDAMGNIEKGAQQINQIIGVIDEIAFQTNLLALNAGVEAARAGEAGRGFAVVASEVRALAQRSAEAAKEIKTLISSSSAQVAGGVELVAETGRALERILGQFNDINAVVADIASGAQEQATGLDQINTSINEMDQVTQQNASMVEETSAASHTLAREAQELSHLIQEFRLSERAMAPRPRPARDAGAAKPKARAANPGVGAPSARSAGQPSRQALAAPQPVDAEDDWENF